LLTVRNVIVRNGKTKLNLEEEMEPKVGRTYTREQIIQKLQENVDLEEKKWGKDYIYTQWARESMQKSLAQYDAGKPIVVETDSYTQHCICYTDEYYSDGRVVVVNYGYDD
jgi:hypothetical protein